ncbi:MULTISPECIES: hypothetical protein, partial [unclassified Akkermansia]|uniref:hypothetical protein n=1 Tax=unclassified Akkermansia TaxID=2608915 RepID=UPI0019571A61
ADLQSAAGPCTNMIFSSFFSTQCSPNEENIHLFLLPANFFPMDRKRSPDGAEGGLRRTGTIGTG